MKKGIIALLLALLLGAVGASSFLGVVGNSGMASIAAYGDGQRDCEPQLVEIAAGQISPQRPSFICYNNLPPNAKFEIYSSHVLVQNIAPPGAVITTSAGYHEFNVVYDARGFAAGTYHVPFEVVVSDSVTHNVLVVFGFTVEVEAQ